MSGSRQRIGIVALGQGLALLAASELSAQGPTASELDRAAAALKDASRDCRVGEAKLAHDQKQLAAQAARWFGELKQAEKQARRKPRKGQSPANHKLLTLSVLAGLSEKGKELAKTIEARATAVGALRKTREAYAKQVWAYEHSVQTRLGSPALTLSSAVVKGLDAGRVERSLILKEFEAQGLKLGKTLRVIEVMSSQAWVLQDVKGRRTFYLQVDKQRAVAVFPGKAPKKKTKDLSPAQKEQAKERKARLKKVKAIKKRHVAALKRLATLEKHTTSLAKAIVKAAGRHTWRPPGAPR